MTESLLSRPKEPGTMSLIEHLQSAGCRNEDTLAIVNSLLQGSVDTV